MKKANKKKETSSVGYWADEMDPIEREIIQWIERLDDVAKGKEATWGIGRLEKLCDPELAVKWQAQIQKQNEAIDKKDIWNLRILAEGTIRGWEALEASARKLGHEPLAPDSWEVKMPSGKTLRICKNLSDARAFTDKDVSVWTLDEVARMVEGSWKDVFEVKEAFPGAEIKEVKDTNESVNDPLGF